MNMWCVYGICGMCVHMWYVYICDMGLCDVGGSPEADNPEWSFGDLSVSYESY